MEEICSREKCTGCSACYNVCPKSAISMVESGAAGYVYPQVDASKCIDCNLCRKVCPVFHPVNLNEPLKAYAATCKNESHLVGSASGGAASSIAEIIIRNGGVVYGSVMLNYKNVSHCRFTSVEEMYMMRGSKYVQSSIGSTYRQAKEDLKAGKDVLFTGTACQIAGLRNYLHRDYENLWCLDLVYHGVPSQKLLRDNVEFIYAQCGQTPARELKVHFRDILSTQTSNLDLRYGVFTENTIPRKLQIFPKNTYITAFMAGLTFRENCYSCPYAQPKRTADITVADFWGYLGNEIPSGWGISLLLPSSAKGLALCEKVLPYMNFEERPVNEAVKGNGQLQHPSLRPEERDRFLIEYERIGDQCYKPLLKSYLRKYRKRQLKELIRKIIHSTPVSSFVWNKLRHNK